MKTASNPRPASSPVALAGSLSDQQHLSDLIGVVYDAAINPSLWENAIQKATYFVGGVGGGLFCKDVGAYHAASPHHFGFDPPLPAELFRGIYASAERHFLGELERPIATTDLIAFGELAETELYREWAKPQGIVDFVSALVDRTAVSAAIFGVFRHERNGIVDEQARRHMSLIAPHFRRAVLIGRMFEFKAAEAATFADTFDGLGAGMYLVDAEGRLIHANVSGEAILGAADVLRVVGGRLVACDAQVGQILRDVFAAAGQGDAALGTQGIAVPLIGKDGERYVAHALPLTSGARRRAGVVYTAAAALFVRKASLAVSSRSEVIGKTFKLTPTELRVLLAIVEVGGIPEVAAALGVAHTTVRTHVSRLFEKTGTARQADLVKLVAGYATPLTDQARL
jgi:DNA-binding CsgD family transcriptional regulator/PAS domain-containing protein